MKAWIVGIKGEFFQTVVFAETRGKARNLARYTSACDGADFTDIEVRRAPQIDKYYTDGKTEMEWNNTADRLALITELNFRCEYADMDDCKGCPAIEDCEVYAEYLEEGSES